LLPLSAAIQLFNGLSDLTDGITSSLWNDDTRNAVYSLLLTLFVVPLSWPALALFTIVNNMDAPYTDPLHRRPLSTSHVDWNFITLLSGKVLESYRTKGWGTETAGFRPVSTRSGWVDMLDSSDRGSVDWRFSDKAVSWETSYV